MPFVPELLDPLRVIQQRHAARDIVVFLCIQSAGGSQFLEEGADDAVGPNAEVRAQGLEMHVALEQAGVHQAGEEHERVGLALQHGELHRSERRGLQRLAVQAAAGQREIAEGGEAVFDDGRGLPHPAAVAHHLQQAFEFPVTGELGGDALVGMRRIGEVVEGQAVRGEAHIALVQRGFQQLDHALEFRLGGRAADGILQAHRLHPQHGVRHEGRHIGAEGHVGEVIHVGAGVVPSNGLHALLQHPLGDVFHPGEAIDDRVLPLARALAAEACAEAAVPHQHGGGAVAHGFAQAGVQIHFQIQVGVDIQHPGQQPLARARHQPPRPPRLQFQPLGDHPPALQGDIDSLRLPPAAVKHQRPLNQAIPNCFGHFTPP